MWLRPPMLTYPQFCCRELVSLYDLPIFVASAGILFGGLVKVGSHLERYHFSHQLHDETLTRRGTRWCEYVDTSWTVIVTSRPSRHHMYPVRSHISIHTLDGYTPLRRLHHVVTQ